MTVQYNPKTKSRGIEWCDETRNPIGGCKHACRWTMPDGTTAVCYAEQLAESGVAKAGYPDGFASHYWRGEKSLTQFTAGRDAKLIFCDSMSDLFGSWVPAEQQALIFDAMRRASHHTYQSLTKAPKLLRRWAGNLPANLWVGISSAPDQMMGRELNDEQKRRYTAVSLETLAQVREGGNVTWMSLEPVSWDMAHLFAGHTLDWVVIGAAMNNGRYYQPEPDHVAKLLEVFDRSGTPVFFKGNVKATIKELGGRWREDFPWANRIGEAIPAVVRRQEQARLHGWTLNSFEVAVQPKQVSFFDLASSGSSRTAGAYAEA
jgi:protein gp37